MTTVEEALIRYPPSVPTRCSTRSTIGTGCPPCPNVRPRAIGSSAVRYQLTYTCDSASYSACYYPRPVKCLPPEEPPVKIVNCGLKWFDCYGKPVHKCCR